MIHRVSQTREDVESIRARPKTRAPGGERTPRETPAGRKPESSTRGESSTPSSRIIHGVPRIIDTICSLPVEVSDSSFFQTNTEQAEVLYQLVRDAADLRKEDVLLDLYCGTGAIGLSLARGCKEVIGVEVFGERLGPKSCCEK